MSHKPTRRRRATTLLAAAGTLSGAGLFATNDIVRASFAKKRKVTRSSVWDDWKHLAGISRGGPKDLATSQRHLKGFGRRRG